MSVVSGKILLDEWRGEPGPATVYVRVQDTSRIDAPARIVAEDRLREITLDRLREDGIEFRMVVRELEPRTRYEVSVLVDLDGDGRISGGDYVSTSAYPVLTRGFPSYVEVHVRPIG